MFINIHFCSKNRKSIESFLRFFSKKTFTKKLKLVIFSRTYVNLSKRNNFTTLKSPHVNKVAQEHFAYHLHRYQLKVYSYKSRSLLLFLKTVRQNLFFDVDFKIEISNQPLKFRNKLKNKMNPDNFFLFKNFESLTSYMQILNHYGHLTLKQKNLSLGSSVG